MTASMSQLKPYLAKKDEELKQEFSSLEDREDVAKLLEVTPKFLCWILYASKSRLRYTERKVPKKTGGDRRICVPPRNIRILQDKLLRVLSLVYSPRPCVTGFVKARSILNNAWPHSGRRFLLSFDLSDFFPSIHLGRVRGMLKSEPFTIAEEAALTLAQISCHHDGHLPQGAPTSPILANMVCGPLDTAMLQLARSHRCVYTRYADDISFSTTQRRFPEEIAYLDAHGASHIGPAVLQVVREQGFECREGKTRLRSSLRRQKATGIVVNEFPNIGRQSLRQLRALIHSCCNDGLRKSAEKHAQARGVVVSGDPSVWIMNVIRGYLAYVKMVRGGHDPLYRRFLYDAKSIPGAEFPPPADISQQLSFPIRRRTRRAPNWPLWVSRYSPSIFPLKCEADNNENSGTAFRVGKSRIITAGHNAIYKGTNGETKYRRLAIDFHGEGSYDLNVTDVDARVINPGGLDLCTGCVVFPDDPSKAEVPTQERLPEIGEEVAAMGYPYIAGREPGLVLHVGRIEAILTGYNKARFISVSFHSGPGLSGAPLVDANGYCLGVMIENTFLGGGDAPRRPYGQAIAIGHWRDLRNAGERIGI